MESVEKTIEIDAPVQKVYNQWTQFEEFPKFMEGVTEVRQLDDKRLHWKAEIGGQEREWDAEIYEQVPDQRIAWRSISFQAGNCLASGETVFMFLSMSHCAAKFSVSARDFESFIMRRTCAFSTCG